MSKVPTPRLLVGVAALLVITGVAAVAGQGHDNTAWLAACHRHERSIGRPGTLPASFPLADGTVLTAARRVPTGFAHVEGVQPLGVRDAAAFLLRELPRAGYVLGRGDSELNEADTGFRGHGVTGHVRVHALPGCSDAVLLVIDVVRA
jgi:hypothetical protein